MRLKGEKDSPLQACEGTDHGNSEGQTGGEELQDAHLRDDACRIIHFGTRSLHLSFHLPPCITGLH